MYKIAEDTNVTISNHEHTMLTKNPGHYYSYANYIYSEVAWHPTVHEQSARGLLLRPPNTGKT